MKKETISILGCGWYGFALAKALLIDGYVVKGSTTNISKLVQLKEAGIDPFLINFNTDDFDIDFFQSDILIICITTKAKNGSSKSYINQIQQIAAIAKTTGVNHLIFISSTGIYEDGNFIVNENTTPKPINDTGKLLLVAEKSLKQFTGFSLTIIRFAGLIGPNRNLAKYFAGRVKVPNGLAPINLIHLNDCIGITKTILELSAFGNIYHGVAPDHPTREAFYTRACLSSGFATPEFIPERLAWKEVQSTHVPAILGYQYQIQKWFDWIDAGMN